MNISIITTSIEKKQELRRLLESINRQSVPLSKIQFIFVDQGENRELLSVLDSRIGVRYIKAERCSLSRARNMALPYVEHEVVAFGDDDCWYSPGCFAAVLRRMEEEGYDGVVGHAVDETGKSLMPSPSRPTHLTVYEHYGACSITLFLRFDASLSFDEHIGVGSPYRLASGEETDYLIEFIRRHGRVIYDNGILIYHPYSDSTYFKDYFKKIYLYSRGTGYLLRKQKYPLSKIAMNFIRPMGGTLIFLLRGKFRLSKRSFHIFLGRCSGFCFNSNKFAK